MVPAFFIRYELLRADRPLEVDCRTEALINILRNRPANSINRSVRQYGISVPVNGYVWTVVFSGGKAIFRAFIRSEYRQGHTTTLLRKLPEESDIISEMHRSVFYYF